MAVTILSAIAAFFTGNDGLVRGVMVGVIVAMIAVLAFLWWRHGAALDNLSDAKTSLAVAEAANAVTAETLTRIASDVKNVAEQTSTLHQGVSALTDATQRGISGVRKEISNAKAVNLADPLPGAVAESLCVQYHKANSRNALRGKSLPDSLFLLPADAFAQRCRTAWARVKWGDVVEWSFSLMEHDGELQLKLDSGAAYYGPTISTTGAAR